MIVGDVEQNNDVELKSEKVDESIEEPQMLSQNDDDDEDEDEDEEDSDYQEESEQESQVSESDSQQGGVNIDLSDNDFYKGLCTLLEDEGGNNILEYISLLHTELIGVNKNLRAMNKNMNIMAKCADLMSKKKQ